jgi:hypothetical protein
MAFHCRPQNSIEAGLVAPAMRSKPFENVGVQPNGDLLLGGRPCLLGFGKKLVAERRDVGIVDAHKM